MKIILTLSVIVLSSCQITVAKLPPPVQADVAGALRQHAENLDVLIADYKERQAQKPKAGK